MATFIERLVDKTVNVITNDGRNFVGNLVSFDQKTNIILQNCVERMWSETKPVEAEDLGVYFIRGDNICVIGEIDAALEQGLDYTNMKAPPIKTA